MTRSHNCKDAWTPCFFTIFIDELRRVGGLRFRECMARVYLIASHVEKEEYEIIDENGPGKTARAIQRGKDR